MKKILTLLALTLVFQLAGGQELQKGKADKLDLINANIDKYFYQQKTGLYVENTGKTEHPFSYLWPLCALIQAANEIEAVKHQAYMPKVLKAIEQYYNPKAPAPGYQALPYQFKKDTRFYDDNQWIAIACLDAYNRTKNKAYLAQAELIYTFMMTGYDTQAGGGLYWEEGKLDSKNTCANGPGIIVALRLFETTKDKGYLESALKIYDWTNKHLRSPKALLYDAIKIPSLKIDSALYTYNTGTMLQSNVLLYKLTNDKKYLDEAYLIAKSAKAHFFKNGRLPREYWFNAVMLRGFVELYQLDKDKGWVDFFVEDANRVWQTETDENGLLGRKPEKRLIDQAAMLEIFATLTRLKLS